MVLIDVGNTSVKVASSVGGEISRIATLSTSSVKRDPFLLIDIVNSVGSETIVVCSVVDSLTEVLKREFPEAFFISSSLKLPVSLDYGSGLGSDRIANASAACVEYGEDVIVVSTGTAVCVDVIEEKVFRGGAIFPGFDLMFSSLSMGTEAIPVVRFDEIPPMFPGKTSEDCVRAGVFFSVLGGIEKLLGLLNKEFKVVLTGGSADILREFLSFASYDRDLTFKGMVYVFELNQ